MDSFILAANVQKKSGISPKNPFHHHLGTRTHPFLYDETLFVTSQLADVTSAYTYEILY